ncbi:MULTISPECIES: lipopolysaccharide assembly protein LapB [unclassified Empedobacter]|uniref:tetratricopeptide repeat protein n=1 Tax=unclassified Empedobacter TaxID=2643773 RepID=UPI0025C3AEA2|nr:MULTISPECIES: tetratricopeptide repeat protein [unclassified Empedobacter]
MDTKTIFSLRNQAKDLVGNDKFIKLSEGLNIARDLYQEDKYDEWIKKAYAWVLIDLCKYLIQINNTNQLTALYKELVDIGIEEYDDHIIYSQIVQLRPKIDSNYNVIQKAEDLSKNGNHSEAIQIFQNLIIQNKLEEVHHEAYGWIIYRYLKSDINQLNSVQVRTFLRDYMNLKNERPSMLHSMILNFALNFSKSNNDFKFFNFFKLWDPSNLRPDDLKDGNKDGNKIPSLISRICREFINSKADIDLNFLFDSIKLDNNRILDFFREPYFWELMNLNKENKFNQLWPLFNEYVTKYASYDSSKWHSEILNLAERFMKENEEWRFFEFFKQWNPEKLRDEDWKETKKDEYTYKPLAIKALKKSFECIKKQNNYQDLNWIIPAYHKAINLFPDDEWLLREKALIHIKSKQFEEAISIYKKLVLELANSYYIWSELAKCIENNNKLKIGLLAKAASLEKNEDFLGEIRLQLAKLFIDENLAENAIVELNTYKSSREKSGKSFKEEYFSLRNSIAVIETNLTHNYKVYANYIPIAEDFAYADFEWYEVVLVDQWKNDKSKDIMLFINGDKIEFVISKSRFNSLKNANLGQVFNFKLHQQIIKKEVENTYSWQPKKIIEEVKYIPLVVKLSDKQSYEILENTFAYVEYINKEKQIVHAITYDNVEIFFPQSNNNFQIGDFITAKKFNKIIKGEKRTEIRQIKKIEKSLAINNFNKSIALVDGVNNEKQLFHFIIDKNTEGIIKYEATSLRPNEGDFIEIIYSKKKDKSNKFRLNVLEINNSSEVNPSLKRNISGLLSVNYKNDYDFDEFDNENDTAELPDFGFIGDYYVPKYLLEKHIIYNDCKINATAIFKGDKWKVISIEKI